jgi:hypothetical protein
MIIDSLKLYKRFDQPVKENKNKKTPTRCPIPPSTV